MFKKFNLSCLFIITELSRLRMQFFFAANLKLLSVVNTDIDLNQWPILHITSSLKLSIQFYSENTNDGEGDSQRYLFNYSIFSALIPLKTKTCVWQRCRICWLRNSPRNPDEAFLVYSILFSRLYSRYQQAKQNQGFDNTLLVLPSHFHYNSWNGLLFSRIECWILK